MTWLVGICSDLEIETLRNRGYSIEAVPEAARRILCLVDPDNPDAVSVKIEEPTLGESIAHRAVMMYVDTDLFAMASGLGWDRTPDGFRNYSELVANVVRLRMPVEAIVAETVLSKPKARRRKKR